MSDAAEWRVRAIWDAIDGGSYKQAIQLAQKSLKKNPGAPIFEALHALASLRLGRVDEALHLCDSARRNGATDKAVLPILAQIYGQAGRQKEISKLYEAAHAAAPRNEELGNLWFMSLVRDQNLKEQQQLALKLHKQFKGAKYLVWAALSAFLQAEDGLADSALMYALSERMMARAFAEMGQPSTEGRDASGRPSPRLTGTLAVLLQLDILTRQGKHADVLAFLEGPSVQKSFLVKEQYTRLFMAALATLGRHADVRTSAMELLSERPDDWEAWSVLIKAWLADESANGELASPPAELVNYLRDRKAAANGSERTFMLAELEIAGRNSAARVEALRNYITVFDQQYHMVSDVASFLDDAVDDDGKQALLSFVRERYDSSENLATRINMLKLRRMLGEHSQMSGNELLNAADEAWDIYVPSLQGSPTKDQPHLDDLALLCSHMLHDLMRSSKSSTHGLVAIAVLETALERSPANFQITMALIRLYCTFVELYETLSIKHVQHDTLSYLLADLIDSIAPPDVVAKFLRSAQGIYASNETETPQMMIKAYENNTYSKVPEFRAFKGRLERSLQRWTSACLAVYNGVAKAIPSVEGMKAPLGTALPLRAADLSDNQDRAVFSDWNKVGACSFEELSRPLRRREETWVKIHVAVIDAARYMLAGSGNGDAHDILQRLQDPLADAEVRSKVKPLSFVLAMH
ncbi:N-acetyltransferase B complex non catalytic subunit-domain-containing protein [Hyaloraphidium curvatum]|nr:N-acetyltransferase B complex non catalytic subunit-domain-containing protein [Hyaloraphidium curvatum]